MRIYREKKSNRVSCQPDHKIFSHQKKRIRCKHRCWLQNAQKKLPCGTAQKMPTKMQESTNAPSKLCRKMVSWIWRSAGSWIQTSRSKMRRMMLRLAYLGTQGSSSNELALELTSESCEVDFSLVRETSSVESAKSSQGRRWRWCMPCRTTHMPFQAAMSVAIPMNQPMKGITRQPRPAEDKVMMMFAMRPAAMVKTPRPRAKITRGRLPLQIAQRMKLG